jgi:CubicO group peptidase (beta-lactamase class C family)
MKMKTPRFSKVLSIIRSGAFFILPFLLLIPSSVHTQALEVYEYTVPEKLDDEWRVSSLEAEGMDEDMIVRMTRGVIEGKFEGIHSILIVKNGAIVHEVYFGDYDRESLQTIFSITKSVSSTLIGIAIDKGFIGGVEETLPNLLPEYEYAITDDNVREIRLKHVLTLTSGLEWDEKSYGYGDPRNSEYNQVRTNDWVEYVVALPLRNEPGTRYVYNTGSVHLLSAIIKSRTGMYAAEFADKYLFKPLGIERFEWNTDPKGYQCTGGTHGGLRMTLRDVAKFGFLFMRKGKWNGRQVVSSEWVAESTTGKTAAFHGMDIGYLWWTGTSEIKEQKNRFIYGAGYGGQSLTMFPDLDLMFVFTCWCNPRDADILMPRLMIEGAAIKKLIRKE